MNALGRNSAARLESPPLGGLFRHGGGTAQSFGDRHSLRRGEKKKGRSFWDTRGSRLTRVTCGLLAEALQKVGV